MVVSIWSFDMPLDGFGELESQLVEPPPELPV
jgi:hypothetical protein